MYKYSDPSFANDHQNKKISSKVLIQMTDNSNGKIQKYYWDLRSLFTYTVTQRESVNARGIMSNETMDTIIKLYASTGLARPSGVPMYGNLKLAMTYPGDAIVHMTRWDRTPTDTRDRLYVPISTLVREINDDKAHIASELIYSRELIKDALDIANTIGIEPSTSPAGPGGTYTYDDVKTVESHGKYDAMMRMTNQNWHLTHDLDHLFMDILNMPSELIRNGMMSQVTMNKITMLYLATERDRPDSVYYQYSDVRKDGSNSSNTVRPPPAPAAAPVVVHRPHPASARTARTARGPLIIPPVLYYPSSYPSSYYKDIHRILAHDSSHGGNNNTRYLTQWEGEPPEEATWEYEEDLDCHDCPNALKRYWAGDARRSYNARTAKRPAKRKGSS